MEKSEAANSLSSNVSLPANQKKQGKPKIPTPEELVTHYESQGLDSKQAAHKAIEDLQKALFRVLSSKPGNKDKFLAGSSRKLDNVNTRLAILEMKMDTKPGFAGSLGIGIASGITMKGIDFALPHVLSSFGQIWNSVKNSTSSS